jgi:nicotinamide riboside transporter PnuC
MDYLSCLLTIGSTILVGRKMLIGWIIAGINSILVCVIAYQVHRYGLILANLFCVCLYCINIRKWRRS